MRKRQKVEVLPPENCKRINEYCKNDVVSIQQINLNAKTQKHLSDIGITIDSVVRIVEISPLFILELVINHQRISMSKKDCKKIYCQICASSDEAQVEILPPDKVKANKIKEDEKTIPDEAELTKGKKECLPFIVDHLRNCKVEVLPPRKDKSKGKKKTIPSPLFSEVIYARKPIKSTSLFSTEDSEQLHSNSENLKVETLPPNENAEAEGKEKLPFVINNLKVEELPPRKGKPKEKKKVILSPLFSEVVYARKPIELTTLPSTEEPEQLHGTPENLKVEILPPKEENQSELIFNREIKEIENQFDDENQGKVEVLPPSPKQGKRYGSGFLLLLLGITLGVLSMIVVLTKDTLIMYFQKLTLELKAEVIELEYGDTFVAEEYVRIAKNGKLSYTQLDTQQIGTFEVQYVLENDAREITKSLTVHIVDCEAPQLLLTESSIYEPKDFRCKAYIASATDNVDGEITDKVTCNDEINYENGVDFIKYEVADSSGNWTSAELEVKEIPSCATNATWNGADCVCNKGYTGNGWEKCISKPKPTSTPISNPSNNVPVQEPNQSNNGWSEWEIVEEEYWEDSGSYEVDSGVIVEWE